MRPTTAARVFVGPDREADGLVFFFFSSRRRHTRLQGDWSSDVCSSDLSAVARNNPYFPRKVAARPRATSRARCKSPGSNEIADTRGWPPPPNFSASEDRKSVV